MSLKLAELKRNIYNSRYIIMDMLSKRGYKVDNYSSFNETEINTLFEQLNSKVSTSADIGPLDIIVERTLQNGDKDKCFIKYRLDEKFKKSKSLEQQILSIYNEHLDNNDTLIILNISKVPFKQHKKDSNIESFIDDILSKHKLFIQVYGIDNFLFDVSKHYTVPEHEIIYKDEIETVKAKYNVKHLSNLPTIRREDPQAKFIGAKPGQICKISRSSESNIHSVIYRLVVN